MPAITSRHIVIVLLCAVAGLLVGGTTAYLFLSSRQPQQPEVAAVRPSAAPAAPPKPGLTEGFQVDRNGASPPIDPMREPPRPGEAPQTVRAEQVEPDIGVGVGRAAVIRLDVRPEAFRITPHLDTTALPPYLVLSASRGGLFTLTIEQEGGGEQEWVVSVHGSSLADPEGEGLVAEAERLALPVGTSAVCALAAPPETMVVVDPDTASVTAVDERTIFVRPTSASVVDLVFEQPGKAPRVVTLDATVETIGSVPPGCTPELTNQIRIPRSGEITIPVGLPATAIHVEDPEVLAAQQSHLAQDSVLLRASRQGSTVVVVSDGKGQTWLRRVVVE